MKGCFHITPKRMRKFIYIFNMLQLVNVWLPNYKFNEFYYATYVFLKLKKQSKKLTLNNI